MTDLLDSVLIGETPEPGGRSATWLRITQPVAVTHDVIDIDHGRLPRTSYCGRMFGTVLDESDIDLPRSARKGERARAGARFFQPLRQTVESIFDTFKDHNLEGRGGHTITGVAPRVYRRTLSLSQ